MHCSLDTYVTMQIDATVESKLGRQYATEGYPTLKWFVDGEPLEFTARGRTAYVLPPLICFDVSQPMS